MFKVYTKFVMEHKIAIFYNLLIKMLLNLILLGIFVSSFGILEQINLFIYERNDYHIEVSISHPVSHEDVNKILSSISNVKYDTTIPIGALDIEHSVIGQEFYYSSLENTDGYYYFSENLGERKLFIKHVDLITYHYRDKELPKRLSSRLNYQILYSISHSTMEKLLHEDYGREVAISEFLSNIRFYNLTADQVNELKQSFSFLPDYIKLGLHKVVWLPFNWIYWPSILAIQIMCLFILLKQHWQNNIDLFLKSEILIMAQLFSNLNLFKSLTILHLLFDQVPIFLMYLFILVSLNFLGINQSNNYLSLSFAILLNIIHSYLLFKKIIEEQKDG